MPSASLSALLHRLTREGELSESLAEGRVRCLACGHRCLIPPGRDGVCRVRFNEGGKLKVPWGYVAGLAVDPLEKKPFFHVLPGASALSFGMLGCDLHCTFCQNWVSSQALRDPAAGTPVQEIGPSDIVALALRHGAPVVTSTYNEPLITSEWAAAVFREADAAGLLCSYVSNGHASPEVLDYLRPWLRLCKVDLKCFRDRGYRDLGGSLEKVLWTIRALHERGVWVEVVTLVVPGFNDSDEELRDVARFLVSVSADLPWHVTAFHGDYKMTEPPATGLRTLLRAAEIGVAAGLHHVYVGNVPGASPWEDTRCPGCGATLIERSGYRIRRNRVASGACPDCGRRLAGVWERPPAAAR